MFFVEPTVKELISFFGEKCFPQSDLQELIDTDLSFLAKYESAEFSELGTVGVQLAFLGAERIAVEELELRVTMRFEKDGYVFLSDGTNALSLRRFFENSIEAAKLILSES